MAIKPKAHSLLSPNISGIVAESRSSLRVGSLSESDFIIPTAPKRQANVLIYGDAGTGKTSFCTRFAPDPIAFINFDRRASHAVQLAKQIGKKVWFLEISTPANVTKLTDEAARAVGQKALDKTIKNFEIAVEESLKGNIRTICLDTGTEYSEILSLAIRGRVDKTKGDYGKSKDLINREWWRILNLAREGNAHLIILARAKSIWVNNEPTGKFTFRGPEVMNDGVDWAGEIRLRKKKGGRLKKEFELEVTKAGVNIEELGEVYTAELWEDLGGPFVYSCLMQYDGSSMEDWQ